MDEIDQNKYIRIKKREKKDISEAYEKYAQNINRRIKLGEDIIVKSFLDWVRAVETVDGNIIQIPGESGESKSEIFERLAIKRMNELIIAFDRIKNLSSKQYESTPDQREKICCIIQKKVDEIKTVFNEIKENKKFEF